MAYELITKKRFNNRVLKVLNYLELEWNNKVANEFSFILERRLKRLLITPFSGAEVGLKDVRSILVTRHNRIYYRVVGTKVIILNMYDTRIDPKRNPYKS